MIASVVVHPLIRHLLRLLRPPAPRGGPRRRPWPALLAGLVVSWVCCPRVAADEPRLPAGLRPGREPGQVVNVRDGSVLVRVPAGTFLMGSRDGDADEQPLREVRLTRPCYVGLHEVTWARYRRFCAETGHAPPDPVVHFRGEFRATDEHPVFRVSWDDARAYCAWAGLRLPTEAEWELAARGRDGRAFPWGDEAPQAGVHLAQGREAEGFLLAPVGSFPAGRAPCGALDMAGGLWEWVEDVYAPSYELADPTDPRGPAAGHHRVLRGGSWFDPHRRCRTTFRDRDEPDTRSIFVGFRVARDAE